MKPMMSILTVLASLTAVNTAVAQGINMGPAAQQQYEQAESAREVPPATMEVMKSYSLGKITLGMTKDEAIAAAEAASFKVKQDFSYSHGTRIVFEHLEHRYAIGLEATTFKNMDDKVGYIKFRNRFDAPSAEDQSPAGANAWATNDEMPRLEAMLQEELGVSGGNLCIITLNQQGVRCKGEATQGNQRAVLTIVSQAAGQLTKELKLEDLSEPTPTSRNAPRRN